MAKKFIPFGSEGSPVTPKKAVTKHEDKMHKGASKTFPPGKGKPFKAGGPTTIDRESLGRNMSRIVNQSGRKGK